LVRPTSWTRGWRRSLRQLREAFAVLGNTTRVIAEHVKVRDELIAEQRRTIAALQGTLAAERGRRIRPKSERRSAG